MNFQVYQINGRKHPEQCSRAMMYSISNSLYNKEAAKRDLEAGVYEKVARVHAQNLEQVFEFTNLCGEYPEYEERIERLAPMHSLSVGDIVVAPDSSVHIVASFGFDMIADYHQTLCAH